MKLESSTPNEQDCSVRAASPAVRTVGTLADELSTSLGDLQMRIASESDPIAVATLYSEMTQALQNIKQSVESSRTDLEELMRLREKARADFGLASGLSSEEVKREVLRFNEVAAVIDHLPANLRKAAGEGQEVLGVLDLQHGTAYRKGFLGLHFCPQDRSHLHSPAYQKLWDHLAAQGLEPHYDSRSELTPGGRTIKRYWLCAKLP